MSCTNTGCTGNCKQGRMCDDSFAATRRAFWLEPAEPDDWKWVDDMRPWALWGAGLLTALFLIAAGAAFLL